MFVVSSICNKKVFEYGLGMWRIFLGRFICFLFWIIWIFIGKFVIFWIDFMLVFWFFMMMVFLCLRFWYGLLNGCNLFWENVLFCVCILFLLILWCWVFFGMWLLMWIYVSRVFLDLWFFIIFFVILCCVIIILLDLIGWKVK